MRRVERLAKRDREVGVRARALHALAELDRERAAAALEDALGQRDARLRCAATALVPDLLGEAAFERLERLLEDASPFVRHRAVEASLRIVRRRSLPGLVQRLEDEPDPRVRARLVRGLQEASGLLHRTDPRPWRDWIEGLDADWRPRPTEGRRGAEDERSTVDSLPIVSSRVAFLVDLSGSIWQARKDGSTPKEIVEGELRRVLESCPRRRAST